MQAKTLFSPLSRELTVLKGALNGVRIHVGAVEQDGGSRLFLHKMMDGPADKSYGIHVAKIAGLPTALLERAATILQKLESESDQNPVIETAPVVEEPQQMNLFTEVSTEELSVIEALKKIDLLDTTPREALNILYDLQKRI